MAGEPCRALVLEDDRPIARLLHTILTREGFAVELVHTRGDAIQKIESNRFHLLVLDLMIRDGGDDVIEYIKHHHLDLLKAMVVVSAESRAIHAKLRGEYPEAICKFVAKPFDVEQLGNVIHTCKQLCAARQVAQTAQPSM